MGMVSEMDMENFLMDNWPLSDYFTYMKATQEEKHKCRKWTRGGNSYRENPWLMAGEDGCLIDFITALRIIESSDPSDQLTEIFGSDDLPF